MERQNNVCVSYVIGAMQKLDNMHALQVTHNGYKRDSNMQTHFRTLTNMNMTFMRENNKGVNPLHSARDNPETHLGQLAFSICILKEETPPMMFLMPIQANSRF